VTATVVADASPLIAFQQIGQLNLLQKVFMGVIVPPAVAREIQPTVPPRPSRISSRRQSARRSKRNAPGKHGWPRRPLHWPRSRTRPWPSTVLAVASPLDPDDEQ
jgi:hypothetical protein